MLYVVITATKKEETQTFYISRRGKMLDVFDDEKNIVLEVKNAIKLLEKLFTATKIKPGSYHLLIDGDVGGTFIHEAFGHCAEADSIKTRSPLAEKGKFKKGLKIAPSYINVYDEAIKFDRGYTPYDEYGVKRKRIYIVKNGKLTDFLSDINHYQKTPNGCDRAETYSDIPIPRMSSTVIEIDKDRIFHFPLRPLQKKIEEIYDYLLNKEIIEKNKKYIYLISCNGGQVLSEEGKFQFNANAAYLFFQGKIKLYKGISFSGKTLGVLKAIIKGSRQMKDFPGTCGKSGQRVPVLARAPQLLVLKKSKSIKIG